MKRITPYSILKELGNDTLLKYIRENIDESTFDSHRIISCIQQDFKDCYERMLVAVDQKDIPHRKIFIANSIGAYLIRNKEALKIEKIGVVRSENMNGTITPNALWKKTL